MPPQQVWPPMDGHYLHNLTRRAPRTENMVNGACVPGQMYSMMERIIMARAAQGKEKLQKCLIIMDRKTTTAPNVVVWNQPTWS